MSGRYCKSCKFLVKVPCRKDGKQLTPSLPADDFWYACDWAQHADFPWAMVFKPDKKIMIGQRHVDVNCPPPPIPIPPSIGDDWTEAMDCPTHQTRT